MYMYIGPSHVHYVIRHPKFLAIKLSPSGATQFGRKTFSLSMNEKRVWPCPTWLSCLHQSKRGGEGRGM